MLLWKGLKPQSVFPIDLNYICCSSKGIETGWGRAGQDGCNHSEHRERSIWGLQVMYTEMNK